MESIDDILAQLKSEYQEKDNPGQQKQQPSTKIEKAIAPQLPNFPSPASGQKSFSEDSLLQKKQPPGKIAKAIEPKLPNLSSTTSSKKSFSPPYPEDALLSQIKTEFAEQDKAEELKKQQQIKEEKIRQEQIKQQQRQALTKEAEAWLKKLNPRSAEGLWFEEFAYSYSSKLEAAIDYLQALKETQS